MSKRNRSKQSKPAENVVEAEAETKTMQEGGDVTVMEAPADDVEALLAEVEGDTTATIESDEADALLASITADEGDTDTTATIEVTATTETEGSTEPTIEEPSDADVAAVAAEDADALLAQIEDEEQPAATPKKGRKKSDSNGAATAQAAVKVLREFTEVASIDKATFDSAVSGAAKKIAEKAQNLVDAVTRGKKLSRYTAIAVKKLAADGRVSGKSLVEQFQLEGLGLGTARAQAQQMTSLFKISGIATPDASNARELVIADQKFVDELTQIAA